MSDPSSPDAVEHPAITDLLIAWGEGDEEALSRLLPLVYEDLRALARAQLVRERPDHTLQPTALVHEAYLRLVDQNRASWRNRSQFYCLAARQFRRILVDYARRRGASKRGGDAVRVPLELAENLGSKNPPDLLEVSLALEELEGLDPELVQVVELRVYGGMTRDEIAEALGLSPSTVVRRWRVARARLTQLLAGADLD